MIIIFLAIYICILGTQFMIIILLVIYTYIYTLGTLSIDMYILGAQYVLTWSSLIRQFFHCMKNIPSLKSKFSNILALSKAISYQDVPLKRFQRVHLKSSCCTRPVASLMMRVDLEKWWPESSCSKGLFL